jgi:hypothetical protein
MIMRAGAALLLALVASGGDVAVPRARKPKPKGCNATMGAYCNASVPTEERIKNLLSLATLEERIKHVTHGGIPRLGVPAVPCGEALHGVNAGCGVDTAGRKFCPTSFPSALGMGASLNESLWNMVGATISTESRAMQPAGGARWAPDINLFRGARRRSPLSPAACRRRPRTDEVRCADPRWGRGQEVPGE